MNTTEQKHLKNAVIKLTIENSEKTEKIKDLEESNDMRWKWYKEKEEELEKMKQNNFPLSFYEVQSGTTRVGHAEGLILQLPKEHEGRNTWLLNYGVGEEAKGLRQKKGLNFNEETKSCETIK